MLYGILTSGSLMLSEIGRKLEDGASDLFYTVKRLFGEAYPDQHVYISKDSNIDPR